MYLNYTSGTESLLCLLPQWKQIEPFQASHPQIALGKSPQTTELLRWKPTSIVCINKVLRKTVLLAPSQKTGKISDKELRVFFSDPSLLSWQVAENSERAKKKTFLVHNHYNRKLWIVPLSLSYFTCKTTDTSWE